MTTSSNVTKIRTAKAHAKTVNEALAQEIAFRERPLPSREVIEQRARDAAGELGRPMAMLQMLSLMAHSEILESEHLAEIAGMGETIDLVVGILEDIQRDIDPVKLLAQGEL